MAKQQKMEKPRAEWGSDVVVDLLKAFEVEYIAINPGATFRGLHDSLVNYGGNHAPEIILCNHEEICRRVGARLRARERQADGRRGS